MICGTSGGATLATFGGAAVARAAAPRVRPPISESWRRSWEAGVDTAVEAAPLVYDRDVLGDARSAHPLAPHLPMLRGLLRNAADETEHLMVITDAAGHALWTEGPAKVRRLADRVGLTDGFCWSEGSIGTNGIGTALASGRPEYVYSAEHVARVLHNWSCAGAPIIDPDSGQIIGCIDVSATVDALHPATVALVAVAARLAEARLENDMHRRDDQLRERSQRHLRALHGAPGVLVTATGRIVAGDPADWHGHRLPAPVPGGEIELPDGRLAIAEPAGEAFLVRPSGLPGPEGGADGPPPARQRRPLLTLALLGTDQPYALLDGRRIPLTLRHAEILALLAVNPRGLTGDRLALHLYGDEGNPVTIRAEIHRLRSQLGDVLRAKPYRLECEVDADLLAVRRLLDDGDALTAVRLCRGELLPRSDAPGVRAERDELAVRMRSLILDRGGVGVLWDYVQTEPGRADHEALERLDVVLPPGDPRRATVTSRLRIREF
ncbi:GAF domain-containing protein [Actinomadura barringtoniae]|uniref:GAF domain-containing protein n=2 Tax=Actinomadura barringtoniae TaxID=1427535 RepID=A0A939PEB6_9ACTN|nr:GAF domain-containing protein [Actinomadura barringtoniae]